MRIERWLFAATTLMVLIVFLLTSAPGLGLVDSGELTTVAETLSIAHPTGYPLYTILGRVWLMVIPLSASRAMVVFSSVCAALASGMLAVIAWRMLASVTSLSITTKALSSVALALAFAFSQSIWSSVSYAEVYPLTLLVAVVLTLAAIHTTTLGERSPRAAVLACYLWGLGFGNHFTILWFFPIILWIAVKGIRNAARPWRWGGVLAGAFVLGVSVNLFLPIRSSVEPLLDWSDPQTIPALFRHLSAWQYRVWMFKGDFAGFMNSLTGYLQTVPHDTGWLMLILAFLGVARAFVRRMALPIVMLLVWFLGVAYNLNYSIPDISTYFAAFYVPVFVLSIFGFASVVTFIQRIAAQYARALVPILAVIVAGTAFGTSVRAANVSRDTFATDYAMSVLETLPDSSIVFQGNWDIQSPVIYLQTVGGLRRDVVMLDLALMQRPWYIKQERRRHPEIFADSETEVAEFLHEVAPFEAGERYDGSKLETAYVGMINRIIENHYQTRPVYVRDTRSVGHPGVAAKFGSFPGGYFFRIVDQPVFESSFDADRALRSNPTRDERVTFLLTQAAMSAVMQGTLGMDTGDSAVVERSIGLATRLSPNDPGVKRFVSRAMPFISKSQLNP